MSRNITDEDLDALVERLTPVLQPPVPPPCGECIGPDSLARHRAHHEFIDELIIMFKRWNEVKWFSIKSVIGAVSLVLLAGFLLYYFKIPLQKP